MTPGADSSQTANQARRLYTDQLIKGLPAVATAIQERARVLLDKAAEPAVSLRRRELVQQLPKAIHPWLRHITEGMRQALLYGVSASRPVDLPAPGSRGSSSAGLSLVDDDTIEREILTSRLALAIMDRASWEFTDLRSRIAMLEGRQELETHDMLRAHVLARVVLDAWRTAGLAHDGWREVQTALHEEFALLVEEAYHEVNRWLVSRRVLPEVDLRPFIRRTKNGVGAVGGGAGGGGGGNTDVGPLSAPMSGPYTQQGSGPMTGMSGGGATTGYSGRRAVVHEETRLMTRAGPLPRTGEHAEAVLGRLNKLVARHLPAFSETEVARPVSPGLANAINQAEVGLRERMTPGPQGEGGVLTTPALLEDLQQRKQALKQAATTPVERATIEIVAMMFQSILTEERIPATVRIWFARLQMPVLRVAVSEPDFFATTDHPARRLIDRMGACVMGFDSSSENVGDTLEKEIKRVVQVVEAYPDTGRRVFQTVLTEFEKFLEHYFKNTNEMTRKGVSLAQQIEQRETLAIQFTIELRRMLNEVPVQEGVRNFLFQVWADVLATTAVRFGAQSDQTKQMKRAAADLIWSASAKVSREERAEVIRRLPPLLKSLRDGMASAGMPKDKQDEHVQSLNNSLAAAFTAKAAVIPSERLEELMSRLESLEEMLPDAADVKIDESMMHDLSGHESADIEVVTAGGSMPTPAMLAWARELQVGSWFMLDYRNRNEAVQLSWQGMKRQLSLFVTPGGRAVLFQQQRLAAFLQAGLLLPAQDESLTVRATRSALAKLDGDPSRLLN
ncbi:Protein of unknown function (DUF1631) [Burkholderiales bacterium JOSHI_001]|nr:Protein of unknown function (DUF1631) [Burkholderiales bacterium JOSHI_001]